MMRIHFACLLLMMGVSFSAFAQEGFRDEFYSALKGKWAGTYETLDYDDDSTVYVMETGLNCDTLSGMVMFTLTFKELDGSSFFDSGDIALSPGMETLYFEGEWQVTGFSSENGLLRLDARREGYDGEHEALMQQSIEVRPGSHLLIVRKVKYLDDDSDFFVRNTYDLSRA